MTTNRGMTVISIGRVVTSSQLRLGFAFALLTFVGATQTGCRSNGCSNCDLGSKFTNGVQSVGARLFNHGDKGGCSTCGTLGSESGVIVDSGVPISPGVISVPSPGTIVPAPAPSVESAPSQLEAIPSPSGSAGTTNPTTSNRTSPGANRSAYEASNPRNGLIASKRGVDLSRAYQPSTSPTQTVYTPEEPDVFDHLPPVDLPSELGRKVTPIEKSATGADSASNPPAPQILPGEVNIKSSSAEKESAGGGFASRRSPVIPASASATPGIAQSASVAPSLAGGSLPSSEGLAWLKEKGYRTLVDLRQRSEVDPTFPDQVNEQGMLYIPIPFAANPISLTRLSRFNELVNQNDQRPLYFCDTDGRRAGLIWYLRLRSKDREEAVSARTKAEELGLVAGDLVEAEKFLQLNFASLFPAIAPTVDPVLQQTSLVAPVPSVPAVSHAHKELARKKSDFSTTAVPFEKTPSWRPAVALVLSGLGVPLAYWSSSTLLQKRAPRRASLMAKGPGPRKSLPSSDA